MVSTPPIFDPILGKYMQGFDVYGYILLNRQRFENAFYGKEYNKKTWRIIYVVGHQYSNGEEYNNFSEFHAPKCHMRIKVIDFSSYDAFNKVVNELKEKSPISDHLYISLLCRGIKKIF